MSEHNETLAEIVAEMRSQSKNEKLSATRMQQRDPDDVDWALANAYDEDAKYLAHTADRIEAAAKRAYNEIDHAVCAIEEAFSYDIDNVRETMDNTIGDYHE